MNAAQKAAAARLANQAAHYNQAQARAAERGPLYLVAFWLDVCRKLAKDALNNGDPTIANKLSAHLNDFYRAHSQ